MRKLIVISFVLFTSSAAFAEVDCSCLDQKEITNECWEFALSSKGDSCQDDYESDNERRLKELEEKIEKLTSRTRKLERRR